MGENLEILYVSIMILVSGVTFYIERRRISYAFIILFSFWLLEETKGVLFWLTIIILSIILANLSRGILGLSVRPITIFEKLIYFLCFILSIYFGLKNGTDSVIKVLIVSTFIGIIIGYFIIDLLNAYLITWITYLFGKEVIYKKVKLQFSVHISTGKYRYKIFRVKCDKIQGEFSPSRKILKRYASVIVDSKDSYANATVKSVKVKTLPLINKMIMVEIK